MQLSARRTTARFTPRLLILKPVCQELQTRNGQGITQLKEGDEKEMCSSFERLLNKEKADGRAEGKVEDRAEAVIELLEDLGALSDSLKTCIMEQTDLELLKKWLKAAARAKSIEEFEQAVGLVQGV